MHTLKFPFLLKQGPMLAGDLLPTTVPLMHHEVDDSHCAIFCIFPELYILTPLPQFRLSSYLSWFHSL